MSEGRTVRLFLAEGTPSGILAAEIMNWTGHVLVAPRSKLANALARSECTRTGVYLLVGDDPENSTKPRIYVGEADSVIERIKSHAKDPAKEFWTHAYVITSKDANLTKAHARYLESRLVEKARLAARSIVANGNEPRPKLLPESDVADMEYFIGQLEIVLPVLGVDVLRMKTAKTNSHAYERADTSSPDMLILRLKSPKHDVDAYAVENDGEITVGSGSVATGKSFVTNQFQKLRDELIADGSMLLRTDGNYEFARDVPFRSPSAAAAVILNRNANGRTEWRLESTGQTLREWQDLQLVGICPDNNE